MAASIAALGAAGKKLDDRDPRPALIAGHHKPDSAYPVLLYKAGSRSASPTHRQLRAGAGLVLQPDRLDVLLTFLRLGSLPQPMTFP